MNTNISYSPSEPPDFTETVAASFHNITYQMTISTIGSETLCVEVEQTSDASRWRGEFTSGYIEDITSKTGNFKRFPVFVKMLVSAIKGHSDSVFVDLLTYQDLELLKSRKGRAPPQQQKVIPPSNKRYLIMTYAAEFDRVHYPLPLAFDDQPDPERLKNIIRQLRAENEQLKGTVGADLQPEGAIEVAKMKEENTALRQRMQQLEKLAANAVEPGLDMDSHEGREVAKHMRAVRRERDLLQAKVEAAAAELEHQKGLHRRELRRKAKELQEMQYDLERAREQVHELRSKCKELQGELEMTNRRTSQEGRLRATYASNGARDKLPSRGTSAQGSRAQSPGLRRPSSGTGGPLERVPSTDRVQREVMRHDQPPSTERVRPSSAPAKHRFDPTEYVKAKKERERQLAERNGRTPSRSAASSGRTSPAVSRPASAERSRAQSRDTGRRQTSVERRRPPPRSTNSSTERERGTAGPAGPSNRMGWGEPSYSKFPQQQQQRPDSSSHIERATSPGKALQDVKAKLSEYVRRQGAGTAPAVPSTVGPADVPLPPAAPAQQPVSSHQSLPEIPQKHVYDDASAEIADIDSRLHALQNFLRMAKTGAAT